MHTMKGSRYIFLRNRNPWGDGVNSWGKNQYEKYWSTGGRLRISTSLTKSEMLIPHLRIVSIS